MTTNQKEAPPGTHAGGVIRTAVVANGEDSNQESLKSNLTTAHMAHAMPA
jgi:hypothetical protein